MHGHESPSITAILVNYRSAVETLQTVNALFAEPPSGGVTVLVVENASGEGEIERLQAGLPHGARLIVSDRNLGFAGGIALAASSIVGDFVLVLNPDARLRPGTLDSMADFLAARPRAAAVGPVYLEAGETLLSSGRRLLTPWRVLASQLGLWSVVMPIPEPPAPFQADWLVGACILFRKEAFLGAGGFDPQYFLYFEEADLCRRVKARGWELWSLPDALCSHDHAPSAARSGETLLGREILRHYLPSRRFYMARFHGRGGALLVDVGTFFLAGAIWLRNALQWWRPRAPGRRRRAALIIGEYMRTLLRAGRGQSPGSRERR